MKKLLLLTAIFASIFVTTVNAQTKIKDGTVAGTSSLPNSAAILDLESANKGLLLPRVALTATTIWGLAGSSINGMTIYDTATAITGTTNYPALSGGKGVYYWDGTGWVGLGSSQFWKLTGNTGTSAGSNPIGTATDGNYLGTTDSAKLVLGVNGIKHAVLDTLGNFYTGDSSVYSTTSLNNIIAGEKNSVDSEEATLITGRQNTSVGSYASANIIGGTNNSLNNTIRSLVTGNNNHVSQINYGIVTGNTNTDSITNGTMVFGANHTVTGVTSFGSDYNIIAGDSNTVYTDNVTSFATNNAVFGYNQHDSSSFNIISGNGNSLSHTSGHDAVFGQGHMVSAPFSIVGGTSNIDSADNTIIVGSDNTVGISSSNSAVFGSGNYLGGNNPNNAVFGTNNTVINSDNLVAGIANKVGSSPLDVSGTGNVVGGLLNYVRAGFSVVGGVFNADSSSVGYNALFGSGNSIGFGGYGVGNLIGGAGNKLAGSSDFNLVAGENNTLQGVGTPFGDSGSSFNIITGEGNRTHTFYAAVFGLNNSDSSNYTLVAGQGNTISTNMLNAAVVGMSNQPIDSALFEVGNGNGPLLQSNAIIVKTTNPVPTATANNSTFNVNGSVSAAVNVVTTDYIIANTDYCIIYKGTADASFTLPDPTTCKGRMYKFINLGINQAPTITFNFNIVEFDGTTSNQLFAGTSVIAGSGIGDNGGNRASIISDGTEWVLSDN